MIAAAERKRAQRERARAEGICSICCSAPARDGLKTCGPCARDAYDRVKVNRALKKTA